MPTLLEDAGTLSVEYDGPHLSMFSFAVIQLELDRAIRRTIVYGLAESGIMFLPPLHPSRFPSPWDYEFWLATRYGLGDRVRELTPIEPVVVGVREGSQIIDVGLALSSAFADPDVRAVALGILSNVLTSLGAKAAKLFHVRIDRDGDQVNPENADAGVVDVGPELRTMASAIASGLRKGGSAKLRFRHKDAENETLLEIELEG